MGSLVRTSPASAQVALSVVPSPNVIPSDYNELDTTASTGPADAWAVGFSRVRFPSPFRANIEHFNGKTWSIVAAAPLPKTLDTRLHGVAALNPSSAWAVGSQASSSTNRIGSLIERWNGSNWTVMASPADEPPGGELAAVTALSAQNVWAVGDAGRVPLIEHFDGRAWSVVPGAGLPSRRDACWASPRRRAPTCGPSVTRAGVIPLRSSSTSTAGHGAWSPSR